MKNLLVAASCVAYCGIGCGRSSTPSDDAQATVPTENANRRDDATVIRDVTFRSHLYRGKVADDPTVKVGEVIRVTPDPREVLGTRESIVVQLPLSTPYEGNDELYYLRGYAVGQMAEHNTQFI